MRRVAQTLAKVACARVAAPAAPASRAATAFAQVRHPPQPHQTQRLAARRCVFSARAPRRLASRALARAPRTTRWIGVRAFAATFPGASKPRRVAMLPALAREPTPRGFP